MPVHSTVHAGVCGFTTQIHAACDAEQVVRFSVETDCPNIRRLADGLGEVDAYDAVGAGFDGAILTAARSTLKGCCAGCVVPNALFKAMQVSAGLALPAAIQIEQRRDTDHP